MGGVFKWFTATASASAKLSPFPYLVLSMRPFVAVTQKTMMYFRKLVGIFLRTASNRMGYRHTVVIQDYLAYLCDTQEYKEAVNMIQVRPLYWYTSMP